MSMLQVLLCVSKKDCEVKDDLCQETDRMLRNIYLWYGKEIEDLKKEISMLKGRLADKESLHEKLKKDNKELEKEMRIKKSLFLLQAMSS